MTRIIITITSPVTHFLGGWLVANSATIDRRDRMLVTVAGVIPDADGAGIIVDFISPKPEHTYFWFEKLHHVLGHNLPFCVMCMILVGCFAKRRWLAVGLAGISFHLHLFCDLIGARGPEGSHWPMPYFWPISDGFLLDWEHQWALNAWPNIVLTLAMLGLTLFLAWKRGFSPVEIFSPKGDQHLIHALRARFGSPAKHQTAT